MGTTTPDQKGQTISPTVKMIHQQITNWSKVLPWEHWHKKLWYTACTSQQHQKHQLTLPRWISFNILYEFVGAIIDCETGELLKYSCLRKNLKYQDAWGIYFEKEIRPSVPRNESPCQDTNRMFFITKEEAPQNWLKYITYGRVVWDVREGKYKQKPSTINGRWGKNQIP